MACFRSSQHEPNSAAALSKNGSFIPDIVHQVSRVSIAGQAEKPDRTIEATPHKWRLHSDGHALSEFIPQTRTRNTMGSVARYDHDFFLPRRAARIFSRYSARVSTITSSNRSSVGIKFSWCSRIITSASLSVPSLVCASVDDHLRRFRLFPFRIDDVPHNLVTQNLQCPIHRREVPT
jgi:hypothetical protein